MNERIIVNVSWCGKNFSASFGDNVPGGVVFTANSFQELQREAQFSLDFHLQGMEDDGDQMPEWWRTGKYEFVYKYSDTQSLLKACTDIVSLVSLSHASGINAKQLSHYATGTKKPRQLQREKIVNGLHALGRELLSVV